MPEFSSPDTPPDLPQRNMRRYAQIALAVALVLAVWGIASRLISRAALARETAELAIPTVVTIKPSPGGAGEDLVLPGSVQAINQASIYARISGYLKSWETDIGTPVKKDQMLAEIDAPEVDQQLRQAEADLAIAEANYRLAQSTNARWQGLRATDSVSRQDADEKAGDAAAKKALVESASANLARLRDLESFKRVLAPFDGIVVARNTDIGSLINAGQGSGTELFRVADTRKLRIYVQVPQPYAGAATPGLEAALHFAERAGKAYRARITRTANALDPNSRTLQVELQVDNAAGELFPGAYAEVHFKLPANVDRLQLPATALIFHADGLQVVTVDGNNRVRLKKITVGRDFGAALEVLSGVGADDNVVINPPDSIAEGTQVRIAPPAGTSPAAAHENLQANGKPS